MCVFALGEIIGQEEEEEGGGKKGREEKDVHPHLHPAWPRTAVDMFAPTNALMRKGAETSDETSPRHLSVVMSAMMICVRSCRPLRRVVRHDTTSCETGIYTEKGLY